LLAPGGGAVVHFDRFMLPGIAQVEYRLGAENHVLVDAALTPTDDLHTRLFAVVSVKTRVPGWLVRPLVTPVALRVFNQDAKILARQVATAIRAATRALFSTNAMLAASERPADSSRMRDSRNGVTALPPMFSFSAWSSAASM
jgi:hypothetical protein